MPESPNERLLEEQKKLFSRAEKEQAKWRQPWERFHRLYHSYRDWRNTLPVDARDRDVATRASEDWGADLFIPITFGLIQTMLPRLIAGDPRMTLVPPHKGREQDVEPVKTLMQRQQRQMDFELKLHDVGHSGLCYGLGVGKSFWRKEYRRKRWLGESTLPSEDNQYIVKGSTGKNADQLYLCYDDPDYEAVDIWDFFWDPFGYDLRTAGYIFHRTWRSPKYVTDLMKSQVWKTIPSDELEGGEAGTAKYKETWTERMKAQGQAPPEGEGRIHEVWEFHDGEKVITTLDRKFIVQEGSNPHWHGELPFQIYRPMKNLHQFVGKGAIEPQEDLQEEINTLRRQRRDNATIALNRSYAARDGLVNPEDLKIGPGSVILTDADPREALYPLPIQDIPNSGYMEEDRLKTDFEFVTGVNDQTAGASVSDGTATEAQIVSEAATSRIKLMTRRLSREVVRQAARQVLQMNQQRILENRDIAIPHPPEPGQAEMRWSWYQVGPEQLQGEWILDPDDESMVPDNIAQKRQDGLQLSTMFSQNPTVDQRRLAEVIARKFDLEPEELLAPQQPIVPPGILDKLAEAGVPQDLITEAWDAAQQDELHGQPQNWPPQQDHPFNLPQEQLNGAQQAQTPQK